jgi:transposase
MSEQLTVTTERVDDIPVLIASMERLGLAELVNEYFVPHGNWQGLSVGQVVTGWLSHILSAADHRLNQVEEWAAKRIETLRGCLGEAVRRLDFSDDRLETVLDLLGQDKAWGQFETALNQRTIRVYNLKPERVRIDTTTANGYGQVSEDGLFQWGHSKDHRPDLPQVKVVLATVDPLGLPVVTQVVAGHKADDRLYIPAINQVRAGVGQGGLLYVGDCKLMALETRAHLAAGDDDYLGPFALSQISAQTLDEYLQPVWADQQPLTEVSRLGSEGKVRLIAVGFERSQSLTATVGAEVITWQERRLVIRSLAHAQAAEAALQQRLTQAQTAIEALPERKRGKKALTELAALRQATEAILTQYQVTGLLTVQYTEQVHQRHLRKYGSRPAEIRLEHRVTVTLQPDETAIQATTRRLGWRVYGTNAPATELSLEQAVLAYREEYLVERNFGRLKGKPLSLTPMYLQDDHRATGLIRLLSVGLRLLTGLEYVARRHLAETGASLAGLYAGNPTRATDRPTTEALLRAFNDICLNFVDLGEQSYRHLTPLSELQHKILVLLDLPVTIYTRLAQVSTIPP